MPINNYRNPGSSQTINYTIDRDPRLAPGIPAEAGALVARTDHPSIYCHSGPLDTDWTLVGDGGGPPFSPPYELKFENIYARLSGNDDTGDGSLSNPYRTFKRAIRDAPSNIPPGTILSVDITGIGLETLPPNYQFPSIAGSLKSTYSESFGGLSTYPFPFGSSLNIRAFPQPASNVPLADTSVPSSDIVSTTFDPLSGLVTITTLTPRVSWDFNRLRGKFCLEAGNAYASCAVYGSDATHLFLCADSFIFLPGLDLSIVECSATLRGEYNSQSDLGAIEVVNCPYIAFQGIKFEAADPEGFGSSSGALEFSGGSQPSMSLCDIEGIAVTWVSTNYEMWGCYLHDKQIVFDAGELTLQNCLIVNVIDFFVAGTNGNVTEACVFDGCEVLTPGVAYATLGTYPNLGWNIVNSKFENCVNPKGAVWVLNGGISFNLENVLINNPVGPGITIEGLSSYVTMLNVNGNNLDYGIVVTDGASVRILDDDTLITGGTSDMKVGTLPDRLWADFRGIAPIKNQYDLAFPPVGDEITGPGSGGTSGSRLFQRPV